MTGSLPNKMNMVQPCSPARSQIPERADVLLGKFSETARTADAEIIDLWRQWKAKRDESNRNSAKCKAAKEKMPKWAQSGEHTGWPEIDKNEPPWKNDLLKWSGGMRPTLVDILKDHRFYADLCRKSGGDEILKEVLALGRARVRAWVARVREQRTWEDRVGYTAAEAEGEVLVDQLIDIEDRIFDTPAQSPVGLVIKIRLYVHNEFGGRVPELPVEEEIDQDVESLDHAIRAVLRDCERMAGAS